MGIFSILHVASPVVVIIEHPLKGCEWATKDPPAPFAVNYLETASRLPTLPHDQLLFFSQGVQQNKHQDNRATANNM
jgi:hypothetical protein